MVADPPCNNPGPENRFRFGHELYGGSDATPRRAGSGKRDVLSRISHDHRAGKKTGPAKFRRNTGHSGRIRARLQLLGDSSQEL